MSVVVEHLEAELNKYYLSPFKELIVDFIHQCIEEITQYELLGIERDFTTDNDAQKFISRAFVSLNDKITDERVAKVLDSLRHAFNSFACNGLIDLYIHQENEGWYPKVVLTEVLEPNDISSLDAIIILYRGCDVSEFIKKEFRQAWTTSLDIAKEFAMKHYSHQDWFEPSSRVVLKTRYPRDNVLFFKQSSECEVVINTSLLGCVEILDCNLNEGCF